jgi:hypothetical protein
MKIKTIIMLLTLGVLTTFVQAEMKCEAGKCGGSMQKNTKDNKNYVYKGNTKYKAIDIKAKEYSCSKCNMFVKNLDYATQIVLKNGNTYFFDDIGCAVEWLENNSNELAIVLTKTLDSHKWMDAKKVWYSRIAPSPMGYGFAGVEHKKDGLIEYEKMKSLMLKGENLRNPKVKKSLLGN